MRDTVLLLLFAARHYGYYHLPAAAQGDAFAVAGSVCIIVVVLMLRRWWPLALWIVSEEALVAGCSAWWLADPWVVEGAEQCSSRVGLKIGSIGLAALVLICWHWKPTRKAG